VTNDICRPAATEDVGIPWYRRNGQQREKAMGSEEITVVLILLGQLITAIGAGIAWRPESGWNSAWRDLR